MRKENWASLNLSELEDYLVKRPRETALKKMEIRRAVGILENRGLEMGMAGTVDRGFCRRGAALEEQHKARHKMLG